jgi:hypothetical protein
MFRALIALVASIALSATADTAAPDVKIVPLSGAGAPRPLSALSGQSHIALIWRSDCAPCLIELRSLNALQSAAGKDEVITIALEPADQARAALTRLAIKAHPAFAIAGNAAEFLAAASDGGQRLPLALALDRNGRICRIHVGLLGADRARAWAEQC